MRNIIFKKWRELQLKINEQRNVLDRDSLLTILFDWIEQLKNVNDSKIQKLYYQYFAYFEEISVSNESVGIKPWYSMKNIIDHDILKSTELSFERPFVKVRDILWELLVIKSNKECTCCGDDNLRVMVYKGQQDLFFTCDICGCIIDEAGNKKEVNNKLFPASYELIESRKIQVCGW